MAQALKDSFLDLERHRELLEENIESLRQSLYHWRTWEVEYEGLKEEILAIQPAPSREQLINIARGYEGKLLKQTELEDILGVKIPRSADQVANILQRRIDYVEQNVKTLEKRLEVAETKLTAATIISNPDVRNEEGLPLTEIFEELDEEGNVISSHTSTPGSSKNQLLEVLQKAGVKDLSKPDRPEQNIPPEAQSALTQTKEDTPLRPKVNEVKAWKKGVQFAEDTKAGHNEANPQTSRRIEEIVELSRHQPDEAVVIPSDESPEDSALRKQMLEYGMSEIGAVVAELNLEEGSDFDDDDDLDDEDMTSTDDEDDFGRSKHSLVDEEMRQRMAELEQKLGVNTMQNAGPDAEVGVVKEGIGRISIKQETRDLHEHADKPSGVLKKGLDMSTGASTEELLSDGKKAGTKGVRFAEALDIQELPQPNSASTASFSKSNIPRKPPVSDIVERSAPPQISMDPIVPPKKVSKFKSARTIKPSTTFLPPPTFLEPSRTRVVPSGPPGKTLADSIVERDTPITAPPEPDELDPSLLHQEVATEYHRVRNRMIQRQGGFMKTQEDESGEIPFEEEEGGPKKVSRFMAARLARG